MKKSIYILCAVVLCVSLAITLNGNFLVQNKTDSTYARLDTYAEGETESGAVSTTANAIGNLVGSFVEDNPQIGDKVSGIAGGIGSGIEGVGQLASGLGEGFLEGLEPEPGLGFGGEDASSSAGGIFDIFGGLLGGIGSTTAASTSPTGTNDTTYNYHTITPIVTLPAETTGTQSSSAEASSEAESTAESLVNPYQKPSKEFKPGEKDESIKWLQWIFVNTGYGLNSDGITGEMDSATVTLIKKFQKERGMKEDGCLTSAVVSEAEIFYLEKTFGTGDSTAKGDVANVSHTDSYNVTAGEDREAPIETFIIIVCAIWIIALSVIIIIVLLKRNKKAAKEEKKEEKSDSASDKPSSGGISSLSDLFEEANK